MSTNNATMPMLSPDGQVGDVPLEQVSDAVKGGYKVGQDMLSPDGKSGTIPLDSVHAALGNGFQLKGAAPKLPQPDMQTEGVVVPDAGRIAGVVSAGNKVTDKQAAAGLAGGAAIGTLPLVATEIGSPVGVAVLKHLAEQSPEYFGHEAVKQTLKRYAIAGAQKAMTGAAWAGGAEVLHSIWDDVFGKKK